LERCNPFLTSRNGEHCTPVSPSCTQGPQNQNASASPLGGHGHSGAGPSKRTIPEWCDGSTARLYAVAMVGALEIWLTYLRQNNGMGVLDAWFGSKAQNGVRVRIALWVNDGPEAEGGEPGN